MVKIYYDKDADLKLLKGKVIGIIGYGIQGHGQAQNLRDSGLNVIVSELSDTPQYKQAEKDGFKILAASELSKESFIIQILAQDHVQAKIYENDIKQNLKKGQVIMFSHGFNIHYGQIVLPSFVDVLMVAPKGPGHLVRREYLAGRGVPSLLAIYQDASGKAKEIGLSYAKGIGATKMGVIETTFKEETETDLFGEQAVLCGGASELIRAAFDTLVEAGYQPEIAYFECLHELKLICDLIYENGINGMRKKVSNTAAYGDITRGRRVITKEVRDEMKKILEEVQNGNFAKEWILENNVGKPVFNALLKKDEEHLIEEVGTKLRKMMPWISAKEK